MSKRRGDAPEPEIVRHAEVAAGLLAIIFSVDRDDLLNRPRPSGKLRCVRDVLIGVLHHKTGISQQKIAAALGRDRGVVSDAAHVIDEAAAGDIGVRFALVGIAEQISNVLTMSDAWNEALRQEALQDAIAPATAERAAEAEEDLELDHAIAADPINAPKAIRCHQCRGEGRVRIHGIGGDPAYRKAWEAAERVTPSQGGFHVLTCRFCNGAGVRNPPPPTPRATLGAEE